MAYLPLLVSLPPTRPISPSPVLIPETAFKAMLGLPEEWSVKSVEHSAETEVVTVRLAENDKLWTREICPSCQQQPVRGYDHIPARKWHDLSGLEMKVILESALPRGQCVHCKKLYRIKASWEGISKRFTSRFESCALSLMKEMPIKNAAIILRIPDRLLWRMLYAIAEGPEAELSSSALRILRHEWVAKGLVVGFEETGPRL